MACIHDDRRLSRVGCPGCADRLSRRLHHRDQLFDGGAPECARQYPQRDRRLCTGAHVRASTSAGAPRCSVRRADVPIAANGRAVRGPGRRGAHARDHRPAGLPFGRRLRPHLEVLRMGQRCDARGLARPVRERTDRLAQGCVQATRQSPRQQGPAFNPGPRVVQRNGKRRRSRTASLPLLSRP
jgi:hypothetical protein